MRYIAQPMCQEQRTGRSRSRSRKACGLLENNDTMLRFSRRTEIWVSVSGVLLILLIGVGGWFVYVRPALPSIPSSKTTNHSIVTIPKSDCSFRPPDGVTVEVRTPESRPIPFRSMTHFVWLESPTTMGMTLVVSIEQLKLAPIGDFFGLRPESTLADLRPTMQDISSGVYGVRYDGARVKIEPFMPNVLVIDDSTAVAVLSLNHFSMDQCVDLLRSITCK